MKKAIRVAIVDDQPVFRAALKRCLEKTEEIAVVAEAGDGYAAIKSVEEQRPHVVLMDINMPGLNGLEATAIITAEFPGISVIVLSMNDDELSAARAIQAGACSYLSKSCSCMDILSAIKSSAKAHSMSVQMLAS